ncbi:MAG: hypothetical protein HY763_10610 [Planctomycetes bacterium]|nr:hypothetical protein [Planctomycetota bacterium]
MNGGTRPSQTLGFLTVAPLGAVYLVGDDVFAAPVRGLSGGMVRVGSLTAYARALADRAGELGGHGVIGQARQCFQQLPVLRFCLLELIPYLRWLQAPGIFPPRPREVQRLLDNATRHATKLQEGVQLLGANRTPPARLALWFGAPCAILGRTVSPLEPANETVANGFEVTVAGTRYRICLEKARPLDEVLAQVDRQMVLWARRHEAADPCYIGLATEFVGEIKSILDRYECSRHARYTVIHACGAYQVHHSGGRFLLARGPLVKRDDNSVTWVGLELAGWERSRLLACAPRAKAHPDMFWEAAGTLARGGLCTGLQAQYLHLQSEELTNAEAVVLWLDAGVNLATGRSAFHRAWRADVPGGALDMLAQRVHRRLRRVTK